MFLLEIRDMQGVSVCRKFDCVDAAVAWVAANRGVGKMYTLSNPRRGTWIVR